MSGRRRNSLSLVHNWISLVGMIVAGSSFFAVACLVALDLFRGFGNPYVGILTYLVAPAFLVTGLLLIAAGAFRERRRRRTAEPGAVPIYPRIDLNDPRQRRTFTAVVVVTVVFLASTAIGSYRTYQFTESVAFCGRTCHAIMTPEYTAYQQSPHARVACAQCHIGPGAGWYVKSKLSGAYQVYATLMRRYPRPIPAPVANLRPARETCEQCHSPQQFLGEVKRTYTHYLPDETNSPWTIQMLFKIGGGDPGFGRVGGIHYHMTVANKIEYIATDHERQVIPWVRVTDLAGRVTVYQDNAAPLKPAAIAASLPRVMDCIDCHNRPTHVFRSPVDAVDLALSTGRIDRALPYVKQQAVLALVKPYATREDARRGIAASLAAFYGARHDSLARSAPASLARAVSETQRIYAQDFFPDMKVTWRVYPDNLGHWNFAGCNRCHDGNHASADGRTISSACTTCHTIVAQGPAGKVETDLAGLVFKHPADVGDAWRTMKCSSCHAGALVD